MTISLTLLRKSTSIYYLLSKGLLNVLWKHNRKQKKDFKIILGETADIKLFSLFTKKFATLLKTIFIFCATFNEFVAYRCLQVGPV